MKIQNILSSKFQIPALTLVAGIILMLLPNRGSAATIALNVDAATALGFNPTQVYYTMDSISSGSPDSTADSSGNGFTGLLNDGGENVPQTSVAGKFGNAIHMEGTASINTVNPYLSYLSAADSELQMNGKNFTMGIWLKFDSLLAGSYKQDLMGMGPRNSATHVAGYSYYIGKSSTDGNWNLNFETRDGTSSSIVATSNYAFNFGLDEWHHFGLSFDDTTNEVVFYVDGVNRGGGTTTVEIGNAANYWNLGERGVSSWNGWFDGAYDDAFITEGVYTFSAVPEPGSIFLLGLGLSALLLRRHRNA